MLNLSNKDLTVLPDNLPATLKQFWCSSNKLTSLPDYLPATLEQLSCYNNQITSLPDNLPNALKELYCSVNNLTSLPDKLPATLEHLTCEYNQITLLPDNLPTTLLSINFNNNPLEANYPGIFAFEHYQIKKIIAYVRKCNAQRRTTQRLRIINAGNVFLELYMKRRMHPDNFKALLADPDIDVDEYMEAYVAAL